jgi:hypothetical protein
MAEQLRGLFEKFVNSPYSKKRTSPPLHKVPTWSNKVRDGDHTTTTLPPPLQLGITVTSSLCITAAHCLQYTNFATALVDLNEICIYYFVPIIFVWLAVCENIYEDRFEFYVKYGPYWTFTYLIKFTRKLSVKPSGTGFY